MGKTEINVRKISLIMYAMENLGQWPDLIFTIAQNTSRMRRLRQLSFCQLLHDLLPSFNIQDPLKKGKTFCLHITQLVTTRVKGIQERPGTSSVHII